MAMKVKIKEGETLKVGHFSYTSKSHPKGVEVPDHYAYENAHILEEMTPMSEVMEEEKKSGKSKSKK